MKLTIDIDCNEKTCGKCRLRILTGGTIAICVGFDKHLEPIIENGFVDDCIRLPECIAACKEQGEHVKLA